MLIKKGRVEKYKLGVKNSAGQWEKKCINRNIMSNKEKLIGKSIKIKKTTYFDCDRIVLKSPIRGRRPTTAST